MKNYLPVLLVLLCSAVFAQYTIESIPNNKLSTGSYVSDPDHILDTETISQIDSILSRLESATTVQVAVVAVNTLGDNDLFEFAEALFNAWGIGNRSNNNGLLILLAKDDHNIRFHTGDGVEGTLPDATCKKIERDYMLPEFKNGNYNAGMLAGITAVNNVLTNPGYAEELNAGSGDSDSGGWVVSDYVGMVIFLVIFGGPFVAVAYFTKRNNEGFVGTTKPRDTYREMQMTKGTWFLLALGFPALIFIYFGFDDSPDAGGFAFISLYFYYLATLFYRLYRTKKVINRLTEAGRYYQVVEFLKSTQWSWFFMGLLFPIPFFPYFFYHLARKTMYRNHSRQCSLCKGNMKKLSEKDDDAFLSKNQVMEEELKSVDYDVWQCEKCQATEEWNYPNKNSKYKECPNCRTHAYYTVGRKTITSATYSHSGKGEETKSCKFCGTSKTSTYTIAQLERSTSSSGSSFSSSSSSSGGSWGGGSSSGGGASSSW